MKRVGHLVLAVDNVPQTGRMSAKKRSGWKVPDWRLMKARAVAAIDVTWVCLTMLAKIVLFVPRTIGRIWRFGVDAGQGILRFIVNFFFAMIGLTVIGFVVFGLGRVIFHPLFH